MHLEYNGVLLDMIHTLGYRFDPVYDPSGVDRECIKVTIDVEGIVHELMIASGKSTLGYMQEGDRAGISLYKLRETLMMPRGQLRLWMANDLVCEAPQRDNNGVHYACDIRGGPFPQPGEVFEVIGDKTARFRIRYECFVSQCEHFMLSNRWELAAHIDAHGYSTHVIRGRAVFRKDFIDRRDLQVDDFRRYIIPKPDVKMRRIGVDVVVSPSGYELSYVATDRVTNYGMESTGITDVEIQVTGGYEYPVKDSKSLIKKGLGIFKGFFSGQFMGGSEEILDAAVSSAQASAIVRVHGQPDADRKVMAQIAASLVLDRYTGAFGFGVSNKCILVSAYLSVDWSSENPPFVELRCEFFANDPVDVKKLLNGKLNETFNWSFPLRGPGNQTFGPSNTRTQLDADNTRGAYVGRLVSQALSTGETECEVPPSPIFPGKTLRTAEPQSVTSPTG